MQFDGLGERSLYNFEKFKVAMKVLCNFINYMCKF